MKSSIGLAWLCSSLLSCTSLGCTSFGCKSLPASRADSNVASHDAETSGDAKLPDLTINQGRTLVDLAIEERTFAASACELHPDENCIAAPGLRRLLRFSVETPNIGQADLFLGAPKPDDSRFQYSVCHKHFHYVGFADYLLLDARENTVASGHKQAFCVVDSHRYIDDPAVSDIKKYRCDYQGLQHGWSDMYNSSLPCQFLDITDLPDGTYTLRLTLNSARTVQEASYENNQADIPVVLGDPALKTPNEPCPELDVHSVAHENRECGWTYAGSWTCTPGALFRIGCANACKLGSCSGDPMLRLCEANQNSQNCSYANAIGRGNDQCGSFCPRVTRAICPQSGQIEAYVAPREPGQPFTCELEFAEDI